MKKLAGFLFIALVFYSIYNDLSHGSLPAPVSLNSNTVEAKTVSETPQFFEHEIQPGDTVLSILEMNLDGPLPVSISDAVNDFQELNNGTLPEEIKIGNSYKFPIYN